MERLNKYLASSGVASRRGADKLIEEGLIKVNGTVVTKLGTLINPLNDAVHFDGQLVKPDANFTYVMLYKPKGCITTTKDELGRKTIYDYLDISVPGLVPVGRLDYETEGLLLLTNDGDLSYALTHPSHEVSKTYMVKVEGEMPENKIAQLRKGVEIDGDTTKRSKVKLLDFTDGISRLSVTITEGRNRQVRRMFECIEKEVIFLKRTAVGDLKLGGLGRGEYRYLRDDEVEYLKKL